MLKTLPRNGKNQEATEKNKRNKSTKRTSKIDEETKKQIKINYIRLFIMFGQKQKKTSQATLGCILFGVMRATKRYSRKICDTNYNNILYNIMKN